MLVILFVTCLVAWRLTLNFAKSGTLKSFFVCLTITILTLVAYCIPVIKETVKNLSSPNFWSIFGMCSLIAWLIVFLLNDVSNFFSYQMAALFISGIFCLFCFIFFYSDHTLTCNEEHISIEIIPLITTVDGTENGEKIYGDSFVVSTFNSTPYTKRVYQYYFRTEDGNIEPAEIPVNRTEVTFIADGEEPYLEITSIGNCLGYKEKSNTHIIRGAFQTYHLYVPNNSILKLTITPTS